MTDKIVDLKSKSSDEKRNVVQLKRSNKPSEKSKYSITFFRIVF